jgi:hypothetical protein
LGKRKPSLVSSTRPSAYPITPSAVAGEGFGMKGDREKGLDIPIVVPSPNVPPWRGREIPGFPDECEFVPIFPILPSHVKGFLSLSAWRFSSKAWALHSLALCKHQLDPFSYIFGFFQRHRLFRRSSHFGGLEGHIRQTAEFFLLSPSLYGILRRPGKSRQCFEHLNRVIFCHPLQSMRGSDNVPFKIILKQR